MKKFGFVCLGLLTLQFCALNTLAVDQQAGLKVESFSASRQAVYGQNFSQGQSPEESVRNYFDPPLDLRLRSSQRMQGAQKIALTFDYFIAGLKVEGAFVKALVVNQFPFPMSFMQSSLPKSIRAQKNPQLMPQPKDSELLYLLNSESGEAALVYKSIESDESQIPPIRRAHYIDASSGKLLKTEDLVYHGSVTGRVSTYLTPGFFPPSASNIGVPSPLPQAQVQAINPTDSPITFSNSSGDYFFSINAPTTDVRVSLINDRIRVVNQPTQVGLSQTLNTMVPGLLNFLLPSNRYDETLVAQTNVFYHATLLHDWIRAMGPDFTAIDLQVLGNANLNSSCNAYYVNNTINFFRASGGCPNTAYTTVIAHEYGHFVVERLGLQQRSFGEGYSDLLAMLYYNTAAIGHAFYGQNQPPLRSPGVDIVPYPCTEEIHHCGQTLAGAFWTIREAYRSFWGEAGIATANQLFIDWTQITGGGIENDSAHPLTAVEILAVDDNDGDIANGTPHYNLICPALQTRNINCPPLHFYNIQMNPARAETITPQRVHFVSISLSPNITNETPQFVRLKSRINAGAWSTTTMARSSAFNYTVQLPQLLCGQNFEYYFEVQVDSTRIQNYPDSPNYFQSYAATRSEVVYTNSFPFEEPIGWSVTNEGVWSGGWQIGMIDPFSFPFQDSDGSNSCWATSFNGQGQSGGNSDLISPAFHINADFSVVSYWRSLRPSWFAGNNFFNAYYRLGSGELREIETQLMRTNAFQEKSVQFNSSDSRHFELIFNHWNAGEDPGFAAIDQLRVTAYYCQPRVMPNATLAANVDEFCVADFNSDGRVDLSDLEKFLHYFEEGADTADMNRDGGVDGADFEVFMRHYLSGC